ncbi:MAG: tail fiber domain-containing protein, partial [Elusimicrobia bacterium]|nr:tail fiber domain-containing protein [Elusimicrobiota bacterium]
SDIRVKKDVRPFTDGLEVIKKLNPISYKLNGKAGLPKDKEGISIIANDVQDIVPYCISKYKAKLEQSDTKETELYDFNSGALTFVLINAVKEQQNEIASITLAMTKQEKEIEELKAEIKKLKN